MLRTYSKKLDLRTSQVLWTYGQNRAGVIEVEMPYDSEDSDIIAELVAIQHVIFAKAVLGFKPLHGAGIEIEVSKGAIKKILNNATTKKELIKYASFIPFLLQGVSIKTHRKHSKDVVFEGLEFEKIVVDVEKYTNTRLLIESPAIGFIEITHHALQRFTEKSEVESGFVKQPLKALVARISHPDIVRVKLPTGVIEHKQRKYGQDDNYSVWKHPTSTINFGLVNNAGVYSLVTVFINKQQQSF
ncbi:hypothetical protein [Thiomicrorhabdus aquaedulcis]|uniref:hypothetical protein n=1 Tax=Thiomicrorhabdus aquaedulcis TaxID=2211106 RepID=UPI000FD89D5C|nr:hypothetical protein [Thiomicrorhabdus aquaedulcis]